MNLDNSSREDLIREVNRLRKKLASVKLPAQTAALAGEKLSPFHTDQREVAGNTDIDPASRIESGYRELFDNSSDLVYIQDEQGFFLDVNNAVLRKYGYTREEIIGRNIEIFAAPGKNDIDTVKQQLKRAWEGEEQRIDWWAVKKNGEEFLKEVVIKKGQFFGKDVIIATGRDISERKRIERSLTESREKYKSLITGLQTGVIMAKGGFIVFINPFAQRLLGLKENPGRKLKLDQFFSSRLLEALKQAGQNSQPEYIEGSLQRADGEQREARLRAGTTDFEGSACLQLIIEDITEVREAEKKLLMQEQNFSMVLDNIDYVTYNFTYTQGKVPEVTFVSRQVENILGLKPETFCDMVRTGRFRELYHPDDLQEVMKAGTEVRAGKKAVHTLYRVRNPKTGTYIWLEESLFLQQHRQGTVYYFGIAKDVTQRVKAEEAIRQNEIRYRNLVERNMAGVFKTDLNRVVTSCNDAFARIFGYKSASELIGVNTREIYQDSTDRTDFLEKLRKKGYLNNHESHIILNDGREIKLLENAALVYDDEGNPEGVEGTLIDITELKHAEQAVRKSEKQYRSLFENSLAGVFRTGTDGTIYECNDAFVKVYGYANREEMLNVRPEDLFFTEEEKNEYLNTLLHTGRLNNYQMRNRRRDGKEIWILVNVSLVDEYPGKQVIEGTLIDVTQLISTQRTLSISERKFRLLSESAPVGIFLTDVVGRPLYVNRVIEDIFNLSAEKIYTSDLPAFIHPEETKQVMESIRTALNEMSGYEREFRVLVDAETRWVKLNARSLKDERGGLTGWVGTLEDVTARKLNEDRIRESEKRFRLLSEAAIEGIVFSEDGLIIDVNDRFASMHGYAGRAEVIGKPIKDFFLERDIRKVAIEGESKQTALEIKSRKKDGNLITLEARGEIIPFYGRNIRISVVYDVSERKKYEEALKESERALSTLLSNLPGMAYRCHSENKWSMDFVSSGAFNLTGYEPRELTGNSMSFIDVVHPEDRTREDRYVRRCIEEKVPFRIEYRITHKSGKVKWVWEQGEAIYDDNNKLIALEGFIADISDRKEYERQLRQSRESYKGLVESSPLGIIILQSNHIVFANQNALDLFGLEKILPEDEARYSIWDYILPEYHELIQTRVKKAFAGEKLPFIEIRIKNSRNEIRELETAASVVDYQGLPSLQVVIQDVSIRKQLEREQLRAEIAEETNRSLQKEISERIKAQRLLTEAQKFTRSIIDSSLDIICATDSFGKVIEFNEAAEKAFGYSREEIIGREFSMLYANGEDYDMVARTIREEGSFSGEIINLHRNGRRFTSYLSASVLKNEDGELIGTMGVSRDITSLKKAENELRQSRERYRALFNQAFIGIGRVSLEGNFLQVNQRLAEILGYTVDELQQKKFLEITHPDDIEESRRIQQELIQGEKDNYSAEKRYISSRGSVIHANLTVSLVRDSSGAPDYFVSVFEDVTDRIRTQQKIFEQTAKLKSLFESSTHLLYTLNHKFELTAFNANFGRLFQEYFGNEPKLGTRFLQKGRKLYDTGTAGDIKEFFLKAFQGERIHAELPLNHPAGHVLWQETFFNPIVLENGEINEISVIAHDVTEKKQAEEKIRESLQEKEVLLKEVHHRVKNNMQVISSILNLQSAYVEDENTLHILRESQNRIKSMAFIHESLYQTADLSKIDFAEYLSNLAKNLVHSYSLSTCSIDLQLEIEPLYLALDASIPCGLIINEILSNSLKYAFPGKEEGKIFITLNHDNKEVSITVGDNGIGLPESFDLENTNTLGLQLVTTLVEQLNGTLTRLPAEGTVFNIRFNLTDHVKD